MAAWTWATPAAAVIVLALAGGSGSVGAALATVCGLGLGAAVMAAVHHAEVIAHRVGEPFGTLVLALAVTIIEASLLLSMMLAGGEEMAVLPRDTIYAAVMIICNGVVGMCLLVGGLAHREQSFRVEGNAAGIAALIAMSALILVLPAFKSGGSGTYTTHQLWFVACASAALWAIFIFIQTVSHRDYFLPANSEADVQAHEQPPFAREAWVSFALLVVSLVAVVGLAKVLSPSIELAVEAANAPRAVVGIAIALLVLLPETVAATRAARANRLQTSLNLAIGSALACIGLTVPVVVVAAAVFDLPLVLGLEPIEMALLMVTFVVSGITLGSGRTHMMQGAVHLVIFAAFLFLAIEP